MAIPRSVRSSRRLQMDLTRHGVPEIPLLGWYHRLHAGDVLPEHTHGQILEICFLVKGRQTYRVDGRDYQLKGGDIFIAFPHEHHSSAGKPEEKGVLYWMMVRPTKRGFFGLPPRQSKALWRALCQLPSRHFRGSWKMKDHLHELTALVHGPDFPLRPTYLSATALAFLLEVLRSATAKSKPKNSPGKIETAIDYIRSHLEEPLSIPDLAAQAGLSTPRFKARFKEETGVPPGEYVLRAKIDEARRRLALKRESVTEIAYALGFSSSQYFATVFKRFTGRTPREA